MNAAKWVGMLTSGGDSTGLNALICAVVHRAANYGRQVVGVEEGTHGLLKHPPRGLGICLGD